MQPDDYRIGARNKKIYSVHVSKNGLVAAGTDKGDILLWELDIKGFRKSNAQKNAQNLSKFLEVLDATPRLYISVSFLHLDTNYFVDPMME